MRISLQLVIAVMAIFGLMGVAAAASPDDSTGPKTPPSSPPELGTGSRPSSNNANRPSRNKGEPVVKSLEDEVYEALGACLKGWFNGWLWRKGLRWEIYLLQCREVALEVGHHLIALPELGALKKEPLTQGEVQRLLDATRQAARDSWPEDHDRLYSQDATKSNANGRSGTDGFAQLNWRDFWTATSGYFSGSRTNRDLGSGRFKYGYSKPASRPLPI